MGMSAPARVTHAQSLAQSTDHYDYRGEGRRRAVKWAILPGRWRRNRREPVTLNLIAVLPAPPRGINRYSTCLGRY
jgi:hypothetical protein